MEGTGGVYDQLASQLDEAARDLGLSDGRPIALPALKRRSGRRSTDTASALSLVDVDGVLLWQANVNVGGTTDTRRRGRARALSGEPVRTYRFDALPPSEVGRFLERLDAKLTPVRGLRAWRQGVATSPVTAPKDGKVLLFIHGTFSHGDSLLGSLASCPAGREFLDRAEAKYSGVLSFDHPTLSVSPFINALDCVRAFAGSSAAIDIVCHSRGGLVARWISEVLGSGPTMPRRVVFVGAPLSGTSLASPPRLRSGLDFLTNVAHVTTAAALPVVAAFPILTVVLGLLRVVSSITSLASKVPLVDAVVAMIPGLAAMSRVGNSAELLRLRSQTRGGDRYFAVRSNFQPQGVGWKFWQYFVNLDRRVAHLAADIVFDDYNDLVVDTSSMTELTDDLVIPAERILDFGSSDRVHHTNYFAQDELAQKLGEWLGV